MKNEQKIMNSILKLGGELSDIDKSELSEEANNVLKAIHEYYYKQILNKNN